MLEKNPALKGILLASVTAVFWGVLAIFLKVAVHVLNPYTIVWIRYLFAFAVLTLWFLYTDREKLKILIRPPMLLLAGAFFLAVNYIGYMQGVNLSGPENAQIIIQLGPILLAAAGVIFFKERITFRQFMGFVIAGIGLYLFFADQSGQTEILRENYINSIYYLVIGAAAWTVYAVIQKKLVREWPAQQLNLVIFGFPVLLFLPFTDFSDFSHLDLSMWLIILFLGINTIVAYGAFAACLKYIEANKASIIVTLNPIITFLIMEVLSLMHVKWIRPESVSWLGYTGAGLVIIGAILAVMPRKNQ